MNKLLSAELYRLIKSRIFKLYLLFSVGLGIFVTMMRYHDVTKNPSYYAQLPIGYRNADGLLFIGSLYLIFAAAAFLAIFIGSEYDNGTIRNKIIVGHLRTHIYLSKLLLCMVIVPVGLLLYIFTVLLFGSIFIEGTTITLINFIACLILSCFALLSFTSLLLLPALLIQGKAINGITCVLVTMIMMFSALGIGNKLDAPEYKESYTILDDGTGNEVVIDRQRNPHYLAPNSPQRKCYEFLNDALPVCQLYQVLILQEEAIMQDEVNMQDDTAMQNEAIIQDESNMQDEVIMQNGHFFKLILTDCIVVLLSTAIGIALFSKKDLN